MSATAQARRSSAGRELRSLVPRSAHDRLPAPAASRDPVAVLQSQAAHRVPELVPVRYARMLQSPFHHYRGSAAVMAMDLSQTPSTGLIVQACGDAHVSNFGKFAAPSRTLVFDVNDFDETLPAPWEWDVKRLAASLVVCGRGSGITHRACSAIAMSAVREYRERMAEYAATPTLTLWYSRILVDDVVEHFPRKHRDAIRRDVAKARRKTTRRAIARLTEPHNGHRRFVETPLNLRLEKTDADADDVGAVIDAYRLSLAEHHRALFDRYRLVDVARRVVGVGSVGTRCWVALFEGPGTPDRDWLVLQIKQAGTSVLEPYAGSSEYFEHGRRVVVGQRLTHAAADVFLGWTSGPATGNQYYVRQLWDAKGASDPALMGKGALRYYGALCGWALARAHARTGDAAAISGYLGRGDNFDRAITRFAHRYADRNAADFAALQRAAADGRVRVSPDGLPLR